MSKLLLPKEHYQALFDAFFAAAKVNSNAFLEFRCQNNIVRAKWSDTNKPYTATDANMPKTGIPTFFDVSRPPPHAVQLPVSNERKREKTKPPTGQPTASNEQEVSPRKLRKRRKTTGITSSSPISATASLGPQDGSAALDVSKVQTPDPPEIARDDNNKSISFDPELLKISLCEATDSESELDCTSYTSPFATPNKFDILNTLLHDETPTTQDGAKTSTARMSCPPCERFHVCYECLNIGFKMHCDGCVLEPSPGPITMSCWMCRKGFTNHEFYKKCITSDNFDLRRIISDDLVI